MSSEACRLTSFRKICRTDLEMLHSVFDLVGMQWELYCSIASVKMLASYSELVGESGV